MLLTQETRGGKESFWNEEFHLVSWLPHNEMVLAGDMNGHVGVVMLAMMGHMVVLGMEIGMQMDPGSYTVCRRAKLSHLQHFVHEAGIPTSDICSWSW